MSPSQHRCICNLIEDYSTGSGVGYKPPDGNGSTGGSRGGSMEIVLVGSKGRAASYHRRAYQKSGTRIHALVDICSSDPESTLTSVRALGEAEPWHRLIVDVCTPTHLHTEVIREAYQLGARR